MVGALFQFNHDVRERGLGSVFPFRELIEILRQNPLVIFFLLFRETNSQNLFDLGRERLFNVLFNAADEKRLKLLVQARKSLRLNT